MKNALSGHLVLADFLIGAQNWLPVAAIALGLVSLLTLWGYRRSLMSPGVRIAAIGLKVVGVLLLAICLIEPLFSGVRPRPGANLFVVLTDNSQSMTVHSGSRVRGESLRKSLREQSPWRTRLQQDFDVRDYMFDLQLHHVDDPEQIKFDGAGSALNAALDTIANRFEQRPVAGVMVLSDGNATDVADSESYPFPVYPIVDEDSAKIKDVRIRRMTVAQTNFEASPVTVNAVVASHGYPGEELTARIVASDGGVLQEQQADPKSTKDHEFRFRFKPDKSGVSFHRMEVFPTKDRHLFESASSAADDSEELTLANNRRWMTVDRGGGPFRVLYVSGRPNWDFKFLRRALDEDDEIRLAGLLRIAKKQPKFSFQDRSGLGERNQLFEGFDGKDDEDAESYDETVFLRIGIEDPAELADGFPKDSDELFRYHAIILDDIEARFFSADQMLLMRRFVNQRGGGLLMLGGQECFSRGGYHKTPVGEVLPVYLRKPTSERPDSLSWQLTREGWLQDWTRLRATEAAEKNRLTDIVDLRVVNLVSGLKPGASVLAAVESVDEQQVAPALVTQRFGKGRAAALLLGDLWRWNLSQKDPRQKDLQQLWRQIVRWMVADVPKRVTIEAERSKGLGGAVSVTVTVLDEDFKAHDNADVQVTVETPGGEEVQLTAEPSVQQAGQYVVDYWPHEEGPYLATARVTTADGEELDLKSAGWTSQPAADEFRELSTNVDALQQLSQKSNGEMIDVDELEAFVSDLPNRKVPVTEKWVYPIWHQPWVLGLAICCFCGEWGLRRWRGLP